MRIKIIIALLLPVCIAVSVFGQDTLSGDYQRLRVGPGIHLVKGICTITDSLVVDAGAEFRLLPGAGIVSKGGVAMNGTAGNRITVTSAGEDPGIGLTIRENSGKNVLLRFVDFSSLLMPLNFINGWARSAIEIDHCSFIRNEGTSAVLQVLNPSLPVNDRESTVAFTLRYCLFSDNKAPIYVEDFNGPHLRFDISSNTFVGNRINGYAGYSFATNLIFGRNDESGTGDDFFSFRNNNLANNFLWDVDADTLLSRANFGVYGTADSLRLSGNYWGSDAEQTVRSGLYDRSVNYTSPTLVTSPFLTKPSSEAPAYFYEIISEGRPLPFSYPLSDGLRSIQLVANKAVHAEKATARFRYFSDTTLNIADTTLRFTLSADDAAMPVLHFGADSLFRQHKGYLVISGVYAAENEVVPDVLIGYQDFALERRRRSIPPVKQMIELTDSMQNKPKLAKPVISPIKSRIELGFVGAYALYYGTLANKKLFSNDLNAMLGIQFRYNIERHLSFSLKLTKGTLTGSDLRSNDSAKIARGFSFKTPITTISAQLEFDFADNRVYSSKQRLRPSIGFGVDYVKFNPTGEYLGKTYQLQSLGTGGQTISGGDVSPYKLSSLGAPITAQLRMYATRHTILSAFATYHLVFTDYLDDVGNTPYPDKTKLAAANPGNEAAALYFSNPTNRAVTKGMTRSGIADGNDSFVTFGVSLIHHF